MRKVGPLALALAVVSGCECAPTLGPRASAIRVHVLLAEDLPATCVLASAAGEGQRVETTLERPDGKHELTVTVLRGELPEEVTLAARPLVGHDGCRGRLRPNGPDVSERSAFSFDEVPVVTLRSGTAVDVTWSAGACDNGQKLYLQVAQLEGAAVTRGTATLGLADVQRTENAGQPVNLSRTFLLYSWRTTSTGPEMCRRQIRGWMPNGNQVAFGRGDGATALTCGVDTVDIAWTRVELPAGFSVQEVTTAMAAGFTSAATTLASAVDATRTVAFAGGQYAGGQCNGEGDYAANDIPGEMRALHGLTDTTLTLNRASGGGSARFTSYVVQFVP